VNEAVSLDVGGYILSEQTLVVLLLYQVPEGILLLYTGLGLVAANSKVSRRVLAGVIYGVSMPIVRSLVGFGIHTGVLMLIQLLLARFVGGVPFHRAFLATTVATTLLFFGEFTILVPLMSVVHISIREALGNTWLSVVAGWIAALPLTVVATFVWRRKLRLIE